MTTPPLPHLASRRYAFSICRSVRLDHTYPYGECPYVDRVDDASSVSTVEMVSARDLQLCVNLCVVSLPPYIGLEVYHR